MPELNKQYTSQSKASTRYVGRIKELVKDNRRIYRGQADASWSLESAASRRIKGSKKAGKKPTSNKVTPLEFEEYHNDLILDANSRGHGYHGARRLRDLEALARLQHNGAATAFIDFTKISILRCGLP